MTITILHVREYRDFAALAATLDRLRVADVLCFDTVLATGPHTLAAQYARERSLALVIVEPQYARYRGRALAEHRNRLLAATTQLVVFHDGADRQLGELITRARSRQLATVVVPVVFGPAITGEPQLYRPAPAAPLE